MQKVDGEEALAQVQMLMDEAINKVGDQEHRAKLLGRAMGGLNQILNHNMGNANILFLLGSCHMYAGNLGLAAQLLGDVVQLVPDFGAAWNNLGYALKMGNYYDVADAAFSKAADLMPDSPDPYCNRSGLRVNQGVPAQCLEYANKALVIEPKHKLAQWHKALAMLELQNWSKAWDLHEIRHDLPNHFDLAPRNYSDIAGEMTPWWDGVSPGLVVIHGEEGIGDEIMFSSCLDDAVKTGAEIVVEPMPRLEKMFRRAWPDLEIHGTHETDGKKWRGERKVDYKCAMGSLPKFYRRSEEAFPRTTYLQADPDMVTLMRQRLPETGKLRVGISWEGGVQHTHVHLRSIPLPALKLIMDQDVDWVSVQYTEDAQQNVDDFIVETGIMVQHWPEIVCAPADYDETAALVMSLDLVITVTQSVFHLCGALGKECWVMTPSKPDWRIGITRDNPAWYGNHVKLFRQQMEEKDWGPCIERVTGALTDKIRERAAA